MIRKEAICKLQWLAKIFMVTALTAFLASLALVMVTESALDMVTEWSCSGFKIYTDHKTGVQYVGTREGLTVRVDREGYPVVIIEEEKSQ